MLIHDILRAADVKRWHIVRVVKEQSLAEHSFNVCMVARAIAKEAGINDVDITKAALAHDLDEVLLGDVPTNVKDRAREKGFEINDLYEKVTGRTLCTNERDILRIADLLEAFWWITFNGLGEHAQLVKRDCAHRYESTIADPELNPNVMIASRKIEELMFHGKHTL
jgi:5'-deoxynucleotidase YfbR-like HD superfamily hydrolase